MNFEYSILKVFVYFDMFRYPLTLHEINSFLDKQCDESTIENVLNKLIAEQKIFRLDEFYSIQNDLSISERRKKGNALATELLKKAEKVSQVLYRFPYVRAVGVSGSVSKNFADEKADIDYFIVTKANRLWIARTLLHLFKKNPLLKHRNEHYCMNYFVDEAEPMITEQNIYTATELYTIIPMAGNGSMKSFFDTNTWSFGYFPNRQLPVVRNEGKAKSYISKNIAEFLMNNKIGDWFDNYFMRLTTRRWKKKQDEGRLNTKGERMGFDTGKHFCKPTAIFFHDSLMNNYQKKLEELRKNWGV